MDYAKESLRLHSEWRGKLEVTPRAQVDSKEALSLAYTPGVAQPCLEIQKDISKSYELTRRWNTVAVVTDGSAVLGLGDIGPEAGMPVMEGKCVLFKAFGGVDAVPLCIRSHDVDEIVNTVLDNSFTRIPVYEGTIDNVVGVLYAKDLLARLAAGKPIEPAALKRDVLFVYRSKRISELLAEFRRAKQHMAVVTDEHGGTLGLVTMEDILEELVGEIWDETDKDETPIRQLSENSWQVEGDVNVEDFFDAIGFVDKTFDCDYNSVGGWALAELEHIPSAGESFGYKQLHVTIRSVKDQRIESLLVTRGEHGGGDAPPE